MEAIGTSGGRSAMPRHTSRGRTTRGHGQPWLETGMVTCESLRPGPKAIIAGLRTKVEEEAEMVTFGRE